MGGPDEVVEQLVGTKVKTKGWYHLDQLNGKTTHFNEDGSTERVEVWEEGKLVSTIDWEGKGNDNTKWKFEGAGNGYHYIKSKKGTYLDVKGGSDLDGTLIWMWGANQGKAQKWKLVSANN